MRDYRERLYVPLAWWLLAIPTVLILGSILYAGLPWPWPIVIFVGLGAGCAVPLIALGRATVEVGDTVLQAGGATLPLAVISEVVVLDEKQTTRLRGPRADPAARLYSRPYLKESVYVAVDPAASGAGSAGGTEQAADRSGISGVPYWLIGTRHPAELAEAIESRRVRGGHEPVA